jgi:hypothetical protein
VVLHHQGMPQQPLPRIRPVGGVLPIILIHSLLDSLGRLQAKVVVAAPGCVSSKLVQPAARCRGGALRHLPRTLHLLQLLQHLSTLQLLQLLQLLQHLRTALCRQLHL